MQSDLVTPRTGLTVVEATFLIVVTAIGLVEIGAAAWLAGMMLRGWIGS